MFSHNVPTDDKAAAFPQVLLDSKAGVDLTYENTEGTISSTTPRDTYELENPTISYIPQYALLFFMFIRGKVPNTFAAEVV